MNETDRIVLSGKTVELSEEDGYLTLINRVCYYGEPNLNNVKLPVEGAEEAARTLLHMPVVAAYQTGANGQPDLKGHEVSVDAVTNEIKFGTENIGTHTFVEIKEDTVDVRGEMRTLPCLFARLKIWKRNKNVCAALKRLFAEGRLHNSWEIVSGECTYENDVKTLKTYRFEANCMLGEHHAPAYGGASSVLAMAEAGSAAVISEAVKKDIASRGSKGITAEARRRRNGASFNSAEKTGLKAERQKSGENAALTAANRRIKELERQIKELSAYKSELERAEKESAKAELKNYALKSGFISEAETEDEKSAVYAGIAALDAAAIKGIIADRAVARGEKERFNNPRRFYNASERALVETDDTSAGSLVGMYLNRGKR